MILDFEKIEKQILPNFKGGEKDFQTHMYVGEGCKIMRASLEPGASIGYHTHESDCEIIFMLEGCGTVLYDDGKETLPAGSCHFCPKGHSHSLRNESGGTITFYAVVPEQ